MALEVVPLTQEYWARVVAHCLAETRAGRTPNPDVLCNSRCALALSRERAFSSEFEQTSACDIWPFGAGHANDPCKDNIEPAPVRHQGCADRAVEDK